MLFLFLQPANKTGIFTRPFPTAGLIIQNRQGSPPCLNYSSANLSAGSLFFCIFRRLHLNQLFIVKIINLHRSFYIFESLSSNFLCFLASLPADLIYCRNVFLPLFSAFADRLQLSLKHIVQEAFHLHIAETASLVALFELVKIIVLRKEFLEI